MSQVRPVEDLFAQLVELKSDANHDPDVAISLITASDIRRTGCCGPVIATVTGKVAESSLDARSTPFPMSQRLHRPL